MKVLLKIIAIIFILSMNNTIVSQESFEFNFDNNNNNRVSFVKIHKNFIYVYGMAYLLGSNRWDNYIAKYDFEGNQIFNTVFYHDYRDVNVAMEIFNDKIYVLSDWDPSTSTYDESVLSIFDTDGNFINSTAFGSNQDDMIADILLDGEDIYVSGSDQSNNYIMKLDNSNLNQKYIKQSNGLKPYRIEGLLKHNNKLFTCGYNAYQQTEFIVQRYNLNGNNEISKKLNVNSKVIIIDGFFIEDNYYAFGLNYSSNSNNMYIFKFDENLNIINQKKLTNATFNSGVKTYNNKFYFTYKLNSTTYFACLDKDFNIEFEKEMVNVSRLIDIQNDYFIYLDDNGKDSKILFDNSDCFLFENTSNIVSQDLITNETTLNNVSMTEGRTLFNLNYSFKNGNLPMNKIVCATPCGDGSKFDSKISAVENFSFDKTTLTDENSYLMTNEKEHFSYGALSHIETVYVSAGFNSEFAFKIDKGYNDFIDGSLPGADGFSLIFHTDNQHLNFKSDQYGGGMGFHNRKNAVALEIDLYNNDEYNDPDGNHIAFQVSKDGVLEAIHSDENTLGISSNIPIMNSDGKETYFCKLEYKDNNLKVWLDNSQDYGDPTLDIPNFKFSDNLNLIEHSKVYVTLAAVTGTSYQKQEVIFWDWCSYYDPISSVEDNTQKEIINIYPNPSSDMIYIDGINNKTNIDLFDLTGRLILQQNYNNGINISELNRGIYILNIYNQNYKIIKE